MTTTVERSASGFLATARALGRSASRDGFRRRCDALRWAETAELELHGLREPVAIPATVGQLADEQWAHHYALSKSAKAVRSILRGIVEDLGRSTPLESVDRARLKSWLAKLAADGQKPNSIRRRVSVLMRMLRAAVDEGWLAAEPRVPPLPAPGEGRLRFLSAAEVTGLQDQLRGPQGREDYADLVGFLVDTGLRMSEALGLSWRDVTGQDGQPTHIDIGATKGGRPRRIKLTDRARKSLRLPADTEGPWSHIPYPSFMRAWGVAREALGFSEDPDYVPHVLRHTFASNLVQRGVGLEVVSKLLGHTSLQMTMRYAHLAPGAGDDAIDALQGN